MWPKRSVEQIQEILRFKLGLAWVAFCNIQNFQVNCVAEVVQTLMEFGLAL
jgi:hypothetical protein